jgi:predicted permease
VISHDYWRRRFHSDPQVLNQRLLIGEKPYSIIGVAREGFFGDEPGKFVDIWLPSMMYNKDALTHRGWTWFQIVGRLSPGVTTHQLQPRLQPVFRSDSEEKVKRIPTMPGAIRKQFLERPLLVHSAAAGVSSFRDTFARPLWIVLGVAAGILLIACANVASLLLARSTARASEMAMRVSLGAGRSRLVRQLLTESLLLSAIAGVLGWTLARIAAPALAAALSTTDEPVRFALGPGFFPGDTRVLLFCAAVSTAAAVFFGLLPAWQASGAQPMRELHGLRVPSGRLRLGRFFVATQVAFAFCLIIGGAAFLFSLRNLLKVDTGFDPHNIAIFQIGTKLNEKTQTEQCNALLDEIQRRIAALPGIQSVTAVQWPLFNGSFITNQVLLPGQPPSEREEIFYSISSNYFATLRTPLLSGRDFAPRDRDIPNPPPAGQNEPVIVNQSFALRYFGTANPVGKIFRSPYNDHLRVTYEIVGVAANSHYGSLRNGPDAIIYVPARGMSYFTLYIRSPLDLGSVVHLVGRETQALGHDARVYDVTTLDSLIGNTILREKLLAGVGGVFAFLGLLLAAIGLFGLLNYSVTRRTKEIGIRAALGARPPSLVYLVLKDMFSMIAGGLVIGMAAALSLMTFVRSLLFGIRPVDPLVMTTAAAVFLLAALIAGGLPASRAAGIDPMVALRHE